MAYATKCSPKSIGYCLRYVAFEAIVYYFGIDVWVDFAISLILCAYNISHSTLTMTTDTSFIGSPVLCSFAIIFCTHTPFVEWHFDTLTVLNTYTWERSILREISLIQNHSYHLRLGKWTRRCKIMFIRNVCDLVMFPFFSLV